jgi:hypothetical protein
MRRAGRILPGASWLATMRARALMRYDSVLTHLLFELPAILAARGDLSRALNETTQ